MEFTFDNNIPIYIQLLEYMKIYLISGVFKSGDKLPSVRDFASNQKFSSKAARNEFERQMIQKNLPMENGNIMGAGDWLKEYMKDNKDSFVADAPATPPTEPKPQFTNTATGKKEGAKMSLSEMMQRKNEDPNFVINFD